MPLCLRAMVLAADTLGGFQLMVSKTSKHKEAAIELVRFLTSAEIQRVNAKVRGYAPKSFNDGRRRMIFCAT